MGRKLSTTGRLFGSIAAMLPFATALISFGCGGLELQSVWSNEGVTIDGVAANWRDSLWVEKDGIKFAVMNDTEYLYLAVVVAKPDLRRQVLMRGLTVWFDPEAHEKRSFGIRYPIGMGDGGAGGGYRREESYAQSSMPSPLAEFEFVSPYEPDRMRVPIIAGRGVQLKINNEGESLLYEMRVPLRSSTDHPYSAETTAGSKVGVGVEVGGVSRGGVGDRSGSEGEGGGGGGGGRRGGGGRGRGSGGGSRGSGSSGTLKPVEVWASVQLTIKAK